MGSKRELSIGGTAARPWRGVLAVLACMPLLASLLPGCGSQTTAQEQPAAKKLPLIKIQPASRGPIERSVALTGEVVATNTVVIAATVEGPIGYCPWREGDRLEQAGQKLIQIDREMYRADVKAAEATLAVAQAKLDDMKAGTRPEEIAKAAESVLQLEESTAFAKSDMERTAQMVKSGSLPGEMLDKARVEYVANQTKLATARRHLEMLEAGYTKTAIAVQAAMVAEAAAKLDLARAKLAECTILSPFAGTITKVHVRPGDLASVRTPLLEMADFSSLVVRFALPEAAAWAVQPDAPVSVQLDIRPGKTFPGRIVRLYPALDSRMRTRTAEAVLDGTTDLAPGMFARVRVGIEKVSDAVLVPVEAVIVTASGGRVAYVVSDGKAVQRKVATGIEDAGRVQVLSGIEPGESVAVAGHEMLKDGMAVRLMDGGNHKTPGAGGEKAASSQLGRQEGKASS